MGLFLSLFLILLNSFGCSSSNTAGFKLVREGSIPLPASKEWRKAVRWRLSLIQVLKGTPDRLVVQDVQPGKPLTIYHLVGQQWKIADGPVLTDSTLTEEEFVCWTTGDVDNDGIDEIVTYSGSAIWVYRWDGQGFKPSQYEVHGTVDQLTIGDIDCDGRNEMVSLRYFGDPHATAYHVCVDRLEGGELRAIWSDRGSLGHRKTDVMPSDLLGSIADYENKGYNVLLTKQGQSDVSPSRYRFLAWSDTCLVVVKLFQIKGTLDRSNVSWLLEQSSDERCNGISTQSSEKAQKQLFRGRQEQLKQWEVPNKKQLVTIPIDAWPLGFPQVIGMIKPIRYREKTLLVVPLMWVSERRLIRTNVLSQIVDGVLKIVWEADSEEANSFALTDILLGANLDGQGQGILHILLSDEPVYRLYR